MWWLRVICLLVLWPVSSTSSNSTIKATEVFGPITTTTSRLNETLDENIGNPDIEIGFNPDLKDDAHSTQSIIILFGVGITAVLLVLLCCCVMWAQYKRQEGKNISSVAAVAVSSAHLKVLENRRNAEYDHVGASTSSSVSDISYRESDDSCYGLSGGGGFIQIRDKRKSSERDEEQIKPATRRRPTITPLNIQDGLYEGLDTVFTMQLEPGHSPI
eukprot:m.45463 g.45463  ORF g.45463 m.45463 type:complete len:216 (-) comp10247_c0_seq1:106-753(-)